MPKYNKLFEEFWYDYMNTTEFAKLWNDDINDSQRYGFIAEDFINWLIKKNFIKENDK